jgi:hypothetical protein
MFPERSAPALGRFRRDGSKREPPGSEVADRYASDLHPFGAKQVALQAGVAAVPAQATRGRDYAVAGHIP